MRFVLVVLLLAPLPAFGQEPAPQPIDSLPQEAPAAPAAKPLGRFDRYLQATFASPVIYVQAIGQAGLDRVTGTYKWDGADDYALRAAAHLGLALTSDSIQHGVAAVFRHEVDYERCACGGAWARVGRALSDVAVTARDDGTRIPNVGLWSGRFAGAAIANAWYPRNYTRGDAARSAAIGIAATAGVNVIREFAPELKRLFR